MYIIIFIKNQKNLFIFEANLANYYPNEVKIKKEKELYLCKIAYLKTFKINIQGEIVSQNLKEEIFAILRYSLLIKEILLTGFCIIGVEVLEKS